MKKIGVLFGIENSFPGALVEEINERRLDGIRAEFVVTGAVQAGAPASFESVPRYAVIVDRISHGNPFYRAFLKEAALNGTAVLNDPFWTPADDKFFDCALAARLGVAVPPTVVLPQKQPSEGVTDRSLRNLEYPLDWEAIFAFVGEHGFLKPIDGGGWRDVREVRNREEFFAAYDASGSACTIYQKAVDYSHYFRCCVVGGKKVRVMAYDPRLPHEERYPREAPAASRTLLRRIERDARTLCEALGYDFNTVEFAVEKGIPYAIDFMNPVPDADPASVGQENFDWMVKHVADLAVSRAKAAPSSAVAQRFNMAGIAPAAAAKAAALKKPVAKKPAMK
jgi:hypothetical protein